MKVFDSENKSIPKHMQTEEAVGIRISPGPYVGIVKNSVDPMRAGRLQVFIEEFGGDETDSSTWRTVSYCSPFFGNNDVQNRNEQPQSYGFWFVPPDIGVKVLCTFISGDPYRGYWFGCVPEWPHHHMVPGMANTKWRPGGKDEPVLEHNFKKEDGYKEFYKKQDKVNEIQSAIYKKQGLIDPSNGKADEIRGPGTSTSFRETPSRVFGIATPGPEVEPPTSDKKKGGPSVKARKGGHMFIMDDGTANDHPPKNQMIKLRTSTGHTIVMNDTAGCIYIINAAGSAWFEMDDSGNIKAFSKNVITMHADNGFKFETPQSFQITAKSFDLSVSGPIKVTGNTIDMASVIDTRIGAGQNTTGQSGSLHLTARTGTYLTGKQFMKINGGQRLDIQAGLITLNSTQVQQATPPVKATPCVGPTKEPYKGHQNVKGAAPTNNSNAPQSLSGSYGSSSGYGEGVS